MNISSRIISIVVISLLVLGFSLSYFSKISMEKMTKNFFIEYEKSMYTEKKVLLKESIVIVHSIVESIYKEQKSLGTQDSVIKDIIKRKLNSVSFLKMEVAIFLF